MARFMALWIALLFLAAPLHAQGQVQKYNGIGNASSLTTIEGISFWYDVTLNTGLLLGEPIISTRFRWLINVPNSQATIPAMGLGEDTYESVALSALGSHAPSKVRIYNVKVEYQFSTSAGTLYHFADAGDPAVGDGRNWSFNVPDAPDWDRMFYRSALQDPSHSRSFVSAQTAKAAFTNSVKLVNARILDAEVSLYDLHNWYMRGTDAAEAIATEKALEDIRISVFRTFGYSVRGVDKAFFPPSTALNTVRSGIGELPSIMSDYLEQAAPRLRKLMQMPKELQNGEDPLIYNTAVKDARKTLEQAVARTRNYRSTDKDPRRFRQGRAAEINRPVEATIVDQYATGPNGKRLSGPYKDSNAHVVANLYVAEYGCLYDVWTKALLVKPDGMTCTDSDSGSWSHPATAKDKDRTQTPVFSILLKNPSRGSLKCGTNKFTDRYRRIEYSASLQPGKSELLEVESTFYQPCVSIHLTQD